MEFNSRLNIQTERELERLLKIVRESKAKDLNENDQRVFDSSQNKMIVDLNGALRITRRAEINWESVNEKEKVRLVSDVLTRINTLLLTYKHIVEFNPEITAMFIKPNDLKQVGYLHKQYREELAPLNNEEEKWKQL